MVNADSAVVAVVLTALLLFALGLAVGLGIVHRQVCTTTTTTVQVGSAVPQVTKRQVCDAGV